MIITRALNKGEKDLLIGFENEQLTIKCMDDKADIVIEPVDGFWTHEALEFIDYNKHSPSGWDAYLGEKWIGSSEI
jgi:hypothetical protein